MPAFPQLSADDIHNISQFLKMQVELAANRGTYGSTYGDLRNKVTGDPAAGAAFFKANCTSCHSATGDLAKIGSKFQQAAQLQSALPLAHDARPNQGNRNRPLGRKVSGNHGEERRFHRLSARRLGRISTSGRKTKSRWKSKTRCRATAHCSPSTPTPTSTT
jgi:mono/diheme cytochrome c family protein